MKSLLLLTFLTYLSLNSGAQVVPNIDWVQNYSERDQIENIPSAIDVNNNVYVTGYTQFAGSRDYTTVKYDPAGNLLWTAHYGFQPGAADEANSIVVDAAGNSYVTGKSKGTTGFDFATVKYDPNGIELWSARYDAAGQDDMGMEVIVDNGGNVFVTGQSTNSSGDLDYTTIMYDSQGNQQWVSSYDGGNGDDRAVGLVRGTGNHLFVTGTSKTLTGDDIVTIRINLNNGNLVGSAHVVNGSGNGDDFATDIITHGPFVVVAGAVKETATGYDYSITKFNGNNSSTIWSNTYDAFSNDDMASSLVRDGQGDYLLTGLVRNNSNRFEYHTLKFNNAGIQQWANQFEIGLVNNLVTPNIAFDFLDHIYVCGEQFTTSRDVVVYQITPSGNTTWDVTHDGNVAGGADAAVDLAVTGLGEIYLAAQTQNGNAKFDYTTIKVSQTPVIFPPDINGEPGNLTSQYYENLGQLLNTDELPIPEVEFYTQNHDPSLFVGNTFLGMLFTNMDTINVPVDSLDTLRTHRVDLVFMHANPFTRPYSFEEASHTLNYFDGRLSQPYAGVRGFQRLMTPNIYPNIDLHYYSNSDGLKYYFVVKPGGDPNAIMHFFDGASSTNLSSNQLTINSTTGEMTLDAPIVYQVLPSLNTIPLGSGQWTVLGADLYGIAPPGYNPNFPLVIMVNRKSSTTTPVEPGNLCWSTYLGGGQLDRAFGVDVDPNGNQYVCGQTVSANFPITAGAFENTNNAIAAFVTKFDVNHVLEFSTFYSPNQEAAAWDIRVPAVGQVYFVGSTKDTSFDVVDPGGGAYVQNTLNMGIGGLGTDGFIVHWEETGPLFDVEWATLFGGQFTDRITGIDVDSNGKIYVTGWGDGSAGTQFPTQVLAGATNLPYSDDGDPFIARFGVNFNLEWCTFFGGDSADYANSIEIDQNNNVYVEGGTVSTDFPTANPGAPAFFDDQLNGTGDQFVSQFNSNGLIEWSTYIGGDGDEFNAEEGGNRLSSDGQTNLYLVGNSSDPTNFPLLDPGGGAYFINTPATLVRKGYVLEFDQFTKQQEWGSFIGDAGEINLHGVEADNAGNVFVVGNSRDTVYQQQNFPGAYFQDTVYGCPAPGIPCNESFLIQFDGLRQEKWSTLFGGDNDEWQGETARDLVLDGGFLYVVGHTSAKSMAGNAPFPIFDPGTINAWVDSTYNGNIQDGYVAKFCVDDEITNIKEELAEAGFLLYPNPTNDLINILLDEGWGNQVVQISVLDIDGRTVLSKIIRINEGPVALETSSLSGGLYMVLVAGTDQDQVKTGKFIKY